MYGSVLSEKCVWCINNVNTVRIKFEYGVYIVCVKQYCKVNRRQEAKDDSNSTDGSGGSSGSSGSDSII